MVTFFFFEAIYKRYACDMPIHGVALNGAAPLFMVSVSARSDIALEGVAPTMFWCLQVPWLCMFLFLLPWLCHVGYVYIFIYSCLPSFCGQKIETPNRGMRCSCFRFISVSLIGCVSVLLAETISSTSRLFHFLIISALGLFLDGRCGIRILHLHWYLYLQPVSLEKLQFIW